MERAVNLEKIDDVKIEGINGDAECKSRKAGDLTVAVGMQTAVMGGKTGGRSEKENQNEAKMRAGRSFVGDNAQYVAKTAKIAQRAKFFNLFFSSVCEGKGNRARAVCGAGTRLQVLLVISI